MRKFLTGFFFVILFCVVSANDVHAQWQDSVSVPEPDSVDVILDSISEQISVSDSVIYPPDESYGDAKEETLYFIGKEDSLSLYDSSVIEWRMVPDTTILALKKDKDFWYADKDRKKNKDKEQDKVDDEREGNFLADLLSSKALRQAIFVFILLLFAVAVVWFLVKNNMNFFGRSKGSVATETTLQGEPENMLSADLQIAVSQAEKNEDYRLAIRLSYLLLLRKLSDEGWIKYKDDTTNMEYLTQLYNQPFYKEFFTVMRSYEYAWYGEMTVSKTVYNHVQQDFAILYTKASLLN